MHWWQESRLRSCPPSWLLLQDITQAVVTIPAAVAVTTTAVTAAVVHVQRLRHIFDPLKQNQKERLHASVLFDRGRSDQQKQSVKYRIILL